MVVSKIRGAALSLAGVAIVGLLSASACSGDGNSTYVASGGTGGTGGTGGKGGSAGNGGPPPCGDFAPCGGRDGTGGSGGGDGGSSSAGEAGSSATGEGGAAGSGSTTVYISCAELHAAEPDLPSGTYAIKPLTAQSEFDVYCDMTTNDGGWTLVLNQGLTFDPLATGDDQVCPATNCVSLAYSTVPVVAGIMLDMKEGDIVDEQLLARAVVTDVHSSSKGNTLRDLFTAGPHFFEAEDNSNLLLTTTGGCDTVPGDANQVLCGTPVLTFGDRVSGCPFPDVTFAIGISETYTAGWANCAGWPQQANFDGNWWPDNVRAWVR